MNPENGIWRGRSFQGGSWFEMSEAGGGDWLDGCGGGLDLPRGGGVYLLYSFITDVMDK